MKESRGKTKQVVTDGEQNFNKNLGYKNNLKSFIMKMMAFCQIKKVIVLNNIMGRGL